MLLTILIPCLNEKKTVGKVISQAAKFLKKYKLSDVEIVVADNGSTDGSLDTIKKQGVARVVNVPIRGYGAALHFGMLSAKGKYVLYADADGSYSFADLKQFIPYIKKQKVDIVLGTRLHGIIKPGAMPFLHRYVGTPILTFLIRIIYRLPTTDCNSGMRLVKKSFYKTLQMRNSGMEWASELLIKTALKNGNYAEVPIHLYVDKRGREPHLIPWEDGWRHLKAIILLKPDTLLLFVFSCLFTSLLLFPISVNIALLLFLGAYGLFLSWAAAHLIMYSFTRTHTLVSKTLLELPLVSLCAIGSLAIIFYTGYNNLLTEDVSTLALFISCIVMITNVWLFFIETIKTHFLYRLVERVR